MTGIKHFRTCCSLKIITFNVVSQAIWHNACTDYFPTTSLPVVFYSLIIKMHFSSSDSISFHELICQPSTEELMASAFLAILIHARVTHLMNVSFKMHSTYVQYIARDKGRQWLRLSRTAWRWTWGVRQTRTPVCQKPQTKWERLAGSSAGPIWGRDKPLRRHSTPGHLVKHTVPILTD